MNVPVLILCFFVVISEHFQRWNDAPCHRLFLSVNGSNRDLSEEIQLYPCFLKQHHAWTLQPTNTDHSYQLITSGSDERKMSIKLVPRVFSFTNMAAGIEKTLGRGWMSLQVVSEKPTFDILNCNVTPRLSGPFSIFGLVFFVLKSLLGIARQWSWKKLTILSLKSRSHVRILKYRTWAIIKIGLNFLAFLLVKKPCFSVAFS